METVALAERYLNTLQVFGQVDEQVNRAVEQYLIDRIIERIRLARSRIAGYEDAYDGQDYAVFSRRVQLDEKYHEQVSQANPLWEQDTLEWMYWAEELETWTQRLNDILSKS
jgi:hypothetical protein